MVNLIFYGDRALAFLALKEISKGKFSKNFHVKVIVSDKFFYKNTKNFFKKKIKFISNQKRDTKKINKYIKKYKIDLILSVQHKWIIEESTINLVKKNAFNLHNSKLPDYKGYNTLSHEIINNEKLHHITIHWLNKKVDTGDIAFTEKIKISNKETSFSLYIKSLKKVRPIISKFLKNFINKKIPKKKQIKGRGVFYKKKSLNKYKKVKNKLIMRALDFKIKKIPISLDYKKVSKII